MIRTVVIEDEEHSRTMLMQMCMRIAMQLMWSAVRIPLSQD
jgi:hypothetical protein